MYFTRNAQSGFQYLPITTTTLQSSFWLLCVLGDTSSYVWICGNGAGRLSNKSNLSSIWILSTLSDFSFWPLTGKIPGSGTPRFSSSVFILTPVNKIQHKQCGSIFHLLTVCKKNSTVYSISTETYIKQNFTIEMHIRNTALSLSLLLILSSKILSLLFLSCKTYKTGTSSRIAVGWYLIREASFSRRMVATAVPRWNWWQRFRCNNKSIPCDCFIFLLIL